MATEIRKDQVENTAVTLSDTQTMANKTFTAPIINGDVTGDRPYFAAKLTTGTYNATSDLIWDSEIVDNTSSYSTSTGIFTAPTTGFYVFGFNILLPNASSGEYRIGFYKNNSIYDVPIYRKTSTGTWDTVQATVGAYMTASDTMRIKYTTGSGAIYTDQNYNLFWGFKIM